MNRFIVQVTVRNAETKESAVAYIEKINESSYDFVDDIEDALIMTEFNADRFEDIMLGEMRGMEFSYEYFIPLADKHISELSQI